MRPVVFDLDGTLIDSVPDIRAALNAVFEAEELAPFDLPAVTSYVGNGLPVLVSRAMAARGVEGAEHARLTAAVLAEYAADPSSRTVIYPGVIAALEALRTLGHPLGLCTNKPEAATGPILRQLGLAGLFDAVLGGGRLPVLKPDPAPLHHVVAALGGGPAVFVGDSEVDAGTAQAADVPFLLYTQGYRKSPVESFVCRAAFDDFAALPGLVAAI